MARLASTSIACAALLLAGCSTLSPPSSTVTVDTKPAIYRTYNERIDLAGRLSLRYQQEGKDQALDGKFTWHQEPGRTLITLLTPFGQTLAIIEIGPSSATLSRNGQPPRTEADVDALAASALGWPLPIAGLRNWLQGHALATDGSPYVASTADNGDATFVTTTEGWQIHYTTWTTEGAGDMGEPSHPRRIDLQRRTSQGGDIALRIVIDQWQPR